MKSKKKIYLPSDQIRIFTANITVLFIIKFQNNSFKRLSLCRDIFSVFISIYRLSPKQKLFQIRITLVIKTVHFIMCYIHGIININKSLP